MQDSRDIGQRLVFVKHASMQIQVMKQKRVALNGFHTIRGALFGNGTAILSWLLIGQMTEKNYLLLLQRNTARQLVP
jgi:hypothetical protein